MLKARTALCALLSFVLASSWPLPALSAPADSIDLFKAASDAANAAITAANAAAEAAKAAASAASAAANAATDAIKSARETPPSAPLPSVQRQAPIAIKQPEPIGLHGLDLAIPAQFDSAALVKEFGLKKLFGVSQVSVAVAPQISTAAGNDWIAEAPRSVPVLDLPASTRAATLFSREVHVAEARFNQAEAQSKQARSFLMPTLAVRYSTGEETSTPSSVTDPLTAEPKAKSTHQRTDTSLTLRQPLLDLPSIYDWRRREKLADAKAESHKASQGDAWLSTVDAYLALTSSRLISDLALGYERQLDQLFNYVDKRAAVGASSAADRERVRARMLASQASRAQQEAGHASAAVEFLRLTNLAPQNIQLPERQDLGGVPLRADEAVRLAMENSPEVAAIKLEIRAAELDRNVAKSKFLPRLDLELSKASSENAGGPTGVQEDTRMMLVMNWNLLNGGADVHLGSEKNARLEEARYRLDDLQRKTTQSLLAQYATLDSSREQLVSGYRELEAISSAAKAMSERMFAGNQSLLDLLDVYDRLYQARTRLVILHTQELSAMAQIIRLVGTPGANALTASVEQASDTDAITVSPPGSASTKLQSLQVDQALLKASMNEQGVTHAD